MTLEFICIKMFAISVFDDFRRQRFKTGLQNNSNLWKSEKPVSYKHVSWKLLGQLVKNKSMQLGFSGFFNMSIPSCFFSLKRVQNEVIERSQTSALKSHIIRKCYLSQEASNCFWICCRSFSIKDLLGLYEQKSNHFLLFYWYSFQ